DAQQEDVMVVARPPLPAGEPNLVTPTGLELLRAEERALAAQLSAAAAAGGARRTAGLETAHDELAQRLASAVVVDPQKHDKSVVRFGDLVTLEPVGGAAPGFTLRLVGVDEADPEADLISFLAPLAQQLLGSSVGQRVTQGIGR